MEPAKKPIKYNKIMGLAIQFQESSNSVKTIPFKEGLTIGRRIGDIIIKDSKLSAQHCRFHLEKGQWILQDLDSVNGIQFFGRKVRQLALSPGTEFFLGKTKFSNH